jgi:2-amino-4-hydroxy-6-hydroxymethyldihydropteridine diphosphokinase
VPRESVAVEATNVVIGLGANLGQPLRTMGEAVRRIAAFAPIHACSLVYRNPAHGHIRQPDFFNAAVAASCRLSARAIVEELLHIERQLGRRRRQRWGPRLIDLDLLWVDGVRSNMRAAAVPHPRLTARAFALVPMLEVVPGAVEPNSGRPYTSWLGSLRGQVLHPVGAIPEMPPCALPSMDSKRVGW